MNFQVRNRLMMIVSDSPESFKKAHAFVSDQQNKLEVFERQLVRAKGDVGIAVVESEKAWAAISI